MSRETAGSGRRLWKQRPRDDAVVFPRQSRHAPPGEAVDGRRGPAWIPRGVVDQQLQRSPEDATGSVDISNGQLESSE